MSVYTKRGDRGTTSLFGQKRKIRKDSPRIAAYGTIDELNSHLGVVGARRGATADIVLAIQRTLFELGAELATPARKKPPFAMTSDKVRQLEHWIDGYEGKLAWSGHFVLPGGQPAAAQLHVARTVCRRAEREIVKLSRLEKVNPELLRYINRLSDLLFVLARTINKEAGIKEETWEGKK